MGKINVDYDVLNQKGSPAWYSDLFANIPTPGYTGRMFISTDTFAFYRDNGTGWDLTGGPGIGTITGSGVSGQVSFFSGTQVLGGSTNLIWDNTNNRLGIGVASPTVTLEISGSVKATALVKSGGTSAQILLADGTTTPTSTFQAAITLTTTGTTGASTLVGATLNVPTYTFVSSVSALTLGTSGTDLTSTVANSTTTPTITLNVPTASATNRGALSSADWTTFNNKQATITLTTTGTSGAATLVGATLNVPNYTNVGTVTSVAALTLGTSGTDLSSTVANSTSTPVITLNVPTASATNRGALSSADWTTFNNKQATISVTAPVVLTGATISMPAATTSVNGYLTSTDWNTFNNKSNTNGTVTSVVALTIGTTGIDITSTAVTTTTTPVITLNIPTASASNRGALSSTDWTTFNNKQATLSLTTTGTSGAATLVANTLNVPNYGSALSGYLPLTGGTLTGALGGTSASFSGDITSGGSSQNLFIANGTTYSGFKLQRASVNKWATFNNNAGTDFYDIYNYGTSSSSLKINFTTNEVTLTGPLGGTSATFSSSITAANLILNGTATTALDLTSGTFSYALDIQNNDFIRQKNVAGTLGLILGMSTDDNLYVRGFSGIFLQVNNSTTALTLALNQAATFSSSVKSTQYLIAANGTNTLYNIVDSDQTYAGQYTTQAGGGSAGYGGGINLFGHSHATKPGYVVAGISAGSGGKFTVNNHGNGGGTELFSIDINGLATLTNALTATSASFSGVVTAGATGTNGSISIANQNGSTEVGMNIRPNQTKNGSLSFTENAVSDRWVMGIIGGDSKLYFKSASSWIGAGTTAFTLDSGGAGVFSSTLGINGTSNNVRSGTYTPTVTVGTNCSAVTAYPCQYMQVDKVVTVSGQVYGSATAVTTETQFTMSVPVGSNFTQVYQCGGTGRSAQGGVAPSGAGYVAFIQAVSTDTVRFSYTAPAVLGTGGNFWFSFTYQII